MESFEGAPSNCGYLASLRNKPQQRQPRQLSASIPAWIVSQCIQVSFDGEKCVLLLCAWKVSFLKSGHILRLAKLVCGSHWGDSFHMFQYIYLTCFGNPWCPKILVTSLPSSDLCLRSTAHPLLSFLEKMYRFLGHVKLCIPSITVRYSVVALVCCVTMAITP